MQWLRNQLLSLNLQGMIVSNPVNIRYLTNIQAEGILLVTRKENLFITDSRYIEDVHNTLTLFDEIVVYDARGLTKEDYENFFMFCENVGFEENYVTYAKYKEYLYRLVSTKKMLEKLNITIETRQDIIDNMENIRKYVRGHNLYDIFYGRYKGEKENAILRAYIDAAPRENFDDIFDAIDNFVYFNNRRND